MATTPQDLKTQAKLALAPIAKEMADVEHIIAEQMASSVAHVEEIARYITAAGGKRMRPALLILMALAMGADPKKASFLGAVIEILHTATLMHDDVVDEGKMRRGRPTANAQWGNDKAVLVGDFLYTRSFQMMVEAGNLEVMRALSSAANRLSEGEVLQMGNAHNPHITEDQYFAVIERKTACLFEAAANMAAAIAQAPEKVRVGCAQYALHLGNAFQIADDILDYQGDPESIGKNLGADLREGKVTLPVLYAMQACSQEERAMIESAIIHGNGDFTAIHDIVIKTNALERCQQRAFEEAQLGEAALECLPSGQYKNSLLLFLSLSIQRNK